MAANDLRPADVNRVVLIGGSMRMPKLRDVITGLFPSTTVMDVKGSPEEVPTLGACIQGQHAVGNDVGASASASSSSESLPTTPAGFVAGQEAVFLPSAIRVVRADGKAVRLLARLSAVPCVARTTLLLPPATSLRLSKKTSMGPARDCRGRGADNKQARGHDVAHGGSVRQR